MNGIDWTDDHQHNPVLGTDPPHSIGDVSSFVYDCTLHGISFVHLPADSEASLPSDHNDKYLATIKMFFAVNDAANWTAVRRSVGISSTSDPSRWPQPARALTPDEIDDRWATSAAARAEGNRTELYGLSAFGYQSQYVG